MTSPNAEDEASPDSSSRPIRFALIRGSIRN